MWWDAAQTVGSFVRWYFADDAPFIPFPHQYTREIYDEVHWFNGGPGEADNRLQPYDKGAPPAPFYGAAKKGTRPCGPELWWQNGAPADAAPLTWLNGVPICCPAGVSVRGCSCGTGRFPVVNVPCCTNPFPLTLYVRNTNPIGCTLPPTFVVPITWNGTTWTGAGFIGLHVIEFELFPCTGAGFNQGFILNTYCDTVLNGVFKNSVGSCSPVLIPFTFAEISVGCGPCTAPVWQVTST